MTSNVYNALQAIKSIVDLDLIPNFSQMVQSDPLLPIHIDDAIVKLNNISGQLSAIYTAPSQLEEYIVSGNPLTSYTFANLDIKTHKAYRIEIDYINGTALGYNQIIYVNDDSVNTNYYAQILLSSGATTSSSSGSLPQVGGVDSSSRSKITINVSMSEDGYVRYSSICNGGTMIAPKIYNICGLRKVSVLNVTSLTISATQALGIGVGTRFRIFRDDT